MKQLLLTLALFGFVFAAAPVRAELKYSIADKWMERPAVPSAAPLPIDVEFGALAKVASANVFADVTEVDSAQVVTPFAERQNSRPAEFHRVNPITVASIISNLINLAHLSYDRSSQDTLVFWHQPDTRHLLDLVVEYQKQIDAAHPPTDEAVTLAALQDHLENNYGWKTKVETVADMEERAKGIDASIPLAKLPPKLRDLVEVEFQAQVRRVATPITETYRAFDRSSWKDARFKFNGDVLRRPDGTIDDSQAVPCVVLSSPNGFYLSIGQTQLATKKIAENIKANAIMPKATIVTSIPPQLVKASARSRSLSSPQTAPAAPKSALPLESETVLRTQVAFTAKRQALSAFVAVLQKQSGVHLQLAPDSFQDAKIVASSAGMKLSDAMQALERLYAAHWTKSETTYTLESDHLDEMHLELAQSGVFAFYTGSPASVDKERHEMGDQIADEVVDALDPDVINTKEGAPFSALPVELQERIMELVRSDAASSLIVSQQRVDDAMKQEVILRLAPLAPQTPNFFGRFFTPAGNTTNALKKGDAGLVAYTKNGEYICQLFPSFSAEKPNVIDIMEMNSKAKQERWRANEQAQKAALQAQRAQQAQPNGQ